MEKRVFINNIDSYASKWIAKCLSERVSAHAASDSEMENEEEKITHATAPSVQIVGTVCGKSGEDRAHVLEEYHKLSKDELLPKLLECDVIIYNITQHSEQVDEASWVVSSLHNKMSMFSGPKMFILISTVMTWARSKPQRADDEELPFTDDDFRRRRAHPNFMKYIDLEKRVVKRGKANRSLFATYVVASGLQYGMGEQVFHHFFKTLWLGQQKDILIFGEGNNIVPTIHVNDLANVIQNVIEQRPAPYYLLAVDMSNNTMEEIVKAAAHKLGPRRIHKRPIEDAYLQKDLSVMEIDSMSVNLRMEAININELFSIRWVCEYGLVKNMELVVEEYRQSRGLLPIRVCVLGPPAVGKSTISRKICEHYKLHHITVKEAVSETITHLEDTVQNTVPDPENDLTEIQDMLENLKESLKQNDGDLDEHLLMKVMRDKLISKPCKNQGFVLDGFPKTYEQAQELFNIEENESDDGSAQSPSYNKKMLPEFLLCLDASDDFLKDRVINLPERLVQEHNYQPENFLRLLAKYREEMDDETVSDYFDELDITPLYHEVTNGDDPDCLSLMQKTTEMIGPPRNYGPSSQEVQQKKRRKAEEMMKKEALERAEIHRKEKEEARKRAIHWEDWSKSLEEVRWQEEEELEALSVPMKRYLLEHVMPTLTRGLIECCSIRPQNPVDFLAEYLIMNNPFHY